MKNTVYVVMLWGSPKGDVYQHRHEAWAEVLALKAALKDPDECWMLECVPATGYDAA